MTYSTLLITLLALTVSEVPAFPLGAPSIACGDLFPVGHNTTAQTSAPPYALSCVAEGDHIDIGITTTGSIGFKGFFVQVREAGSDATSGTFGLFEQGISRGVPCADVADTGATHTINTEKQSVNLHYYPEDPLPTSLVILATVVQEVEIFWTGLELDFANCS